MRMTDVVEQPIELSGFLTVRTAAGGRDAILKLLHERDSVSLKLSADADLDIAGIQLILAARNYARDASKTVSLSNPISGRALSVLECAGFLTEMSVDDRHFWFHEGA